MLLKEALAVSSSRRWAFLDPFAFLSWVCALCSQAQSGTLIFFKSPFTLGSWSYANKAIQIILWLKTNQSLQFFQLQIRLSSIFNMGVGASRIPLLQGFQRVHFFTGWNHISPKASSSHARQPDRIEVTCVLHMMKFFYLLAQASLNLVSKMTLYFWSSCLYVLCAFCLLISRQAVFKLRNPPALASKVLGFKVWATWPGSLKVLLNVCI